MAQEGETSTLNWGGRIGSALVGVLTVINEEFDEIAPVLGTTENIAGTPYYVRQLVSPGAHDVVLMQLGGRGNVKAASAAKKLLEDFRPPYVLLVGIAGGVMGRDGTGIADVIVPNFIDYYEIRKLHAGRSLRRVEPHDHPGCSMLNYFALPVARKKEWVTKIDPTRRPGQDGNLPQFRSGYLISGEKVLGDDEAIIQQHLLKEFDNAVAVDMESFGVAEAIFSTRVTRHYNPQFLVVRGISDLIEETNKIPPLKALANSLIGRLRSGLISHSSHGRAEIMQDNNATRKKWKPYAAHAAAVFAAAVIERLLETTRSTSATTNAIE